MRKAISLEWKNPPVWLHGEIAPGTPLAHNGYLCGVIDVGIMGISDAACDYAMEFFDNDSRNCFLQGGDGKTIDRARGWV